jgi:hypothetical protein
LNAFASAPGFKLKNRTKVNTAFSKSEEPPLNQESEQKGAALLDGKERTNCAHDMFILAIL